MIFRTREILKAYAAARKPSIGIRRKLALYWISMALSVFAGFLLILSVTGVFSDSEQRVGELLSFQQAGSAAALSAQTDELTARCISMSREISRSINVSLNEHGISFSELNNNAEVLCEIQEKLFAPLNATMLVSRCSGAFAVLDATTNTRAKSASVSRSGIYLRATNISTQSNPGQELTYFRGIPDIARSEGIQLHNRWNLEFNSSLLPGYEDRMGTTVTRLADACFWSGKIPLPDTWENTLLLFVPILDGNEKICGLCGIEISELYFKLLYPGLSSPYGNIMTLIAPDDGGETIPLDGAMMGGTEGSYLEASGALQIQPGNNYNTYSIGGEAYVGIHHPLALKDAEGSAMNLVTLISSGGVHQVVAQKKVQLVIVSLILLLLMVGISLFLSSRFVRPIAQSLKAIQTEQPLSEQHSGISEIDSLLAFLHSKFQNQPIPGEALPPKIQELLGSFKERAAALTPMERTVLQYYIDGLGIDEIAAAAFISVSTARKHTTNIKKKLEVTSREELMLYIDLFRRCGRIEDISYQG